VNVQIAFVSVPSLLP